MKKNENTLDRIIRIILAVALAIAVAFKAVSGVAAVALLAASLVLLVTGAIGFCGIYALLGLSTCRIPRKT